jgi:hypothetical protein
VYRYKETDCEAATASAGGTAAEERKNDQEPCRVGFREAKCFYNTLSTKGRGRVPPAMLFVADFVNGQDRQNHVYLIEQVLLNAKKVMGQYLSLVGVQFQ